MIRKEIVDFLKLTKNEWVECRRYLHTNPETSMSEYNTSRYIKQQLYKWGFSVHNFGNTGVLGILQNGDSQKKIAIRADMDALEIKEKNKFNYCAKENKMHACGHDGHITMLLATCKFLSESKSFNGTFYAIFQPGEEDASGAVAMIDDGLYNVMQADKIYALHNVPTSLLKNGKLGDFHAYSGEGGTLTSNDLLEYKITGKGSHGSAPQNGFDPIVTVSSIIVNLQTIVSRRISAFEKVVITVGEVKSGSATNVIPEYATIKISVRCLDQEIRKNVIEYIDEYIIKTAETFNCSAVKTFHKKCPLTINDPQTLKFAKDLIINTFGENKLHECDPLLASEDFGLYLQKIPGCMIFINNGESNPLHTETYDFNDAIIPYGVSFFITLIETEMPL